MLSTLAEVLNYQHEKVIKSYTKTYQVDIDKATELFREMLKYLWLAKKHTLDKKQNPAQEGLQFQFVMHEEMRDMDNMWHNFILYTHDYTQFCEKYFGEYLHHEPDIAESGPQDNEEFSKELEKYLTYIYDNLGEETVRNWFAPRVSE